jgi:toxin ParE1/3/4
VAAGGCFARPCRIFGRSLDGCAVRRIAGTHQGAARRKKSLEALARVIFTALAESQIDSLPTYIALHSSEVRADGYIQRIAAFCEGLSLFPLRGSRRDDLLKGLGTIGFERRITIAFVVTAEGLLIEGIFYGGQDFEAAIKDGR